MTRQQFRDLVDTTLADRSLTPAHQANLITAAADEYAANMIEAHARPDTLRGVA